MTTAKPRPLVLDARLPTLTTPQATERLLLFIYGRNGTGKTVLAASACDVESLQPILYCDTEGGLLSVSHREVAVFPVVTSADFAVLTKYLREATAAGDLPYKTLIIDSLTRAAAFAMSAIVKSVPNASRKVKDVEEGADYQIFNHRFMEFIRAITSTAYNINVICTATDMESQEGKIGPDLPGRKVPGQLAGYFNTVGWLENYNVANPSGKGVLTRRRLLVGPDEVVLTKDRSDKFGTLPRYINAPTIQALLQRMEEGRQVAERLSQTQSGPTEETEPSV